MMKYKLMEYKFWSFIYKYSRKQLLKIDKSIGSSTDGGGNYRIKRYPLSKKVVIPFSTEVKSMESWRQYFNNKSNKTGPL